MADQPTWWYNTAEFWIGYPHWRMEPTTKVYYLSQFSYWLQQMLVAAFRIEKPRSDFVELIIHVSGCDVNSKDNFLKLIGMI